MSSFTYAMVAYRDTPLAEYDGGSGGNYKKIARELLGSLKFDGKKNSFEQGGFVFSVISEASKLSVIVLSSQQVDAKLRFHVVEEVRSKFTGRYLSSYTSAGELSKSAEFGPVIRQVFTECSNASATKLAQINANLSDAREEMIQNLAMALQRGEQLEVMEAKATNIAQSANQFKREATSVRRGMLCGRIKWYILGGTIAVAVIVIIVLIAVYA